MADLKENKLGFKRPYKGTFRITSPYGYRNITLRGKTNREFHNGIDLALPMSTPILAPASGVVSLVGANTAATKLGGNSLIIVHENGWRTGYADLSRFEVKDKQKVVAGQVIALSGNPAGLSTGPHLHFTLTNPNGDKVDPTDYIDFTSVLT